MTLRAVERGDGKILLRAASSLSTTLALGQLSTRSTLLDEAGRALLLRVREFMDKSVQPARRNGTEWELDGQKKWLGNATFADYVIIWALDLEGGQVKGVVVEKGTPGFSASKMQNKIALRVVQNTHIAPDGVRVPEANRLQRGCRSCSRRASPKITIPRRPRRGALENERQVVRRGCRWSAACCGSPSVQAPR